MPTCPGCERTVSHENLDVHERHCHGLWRADGGDESAAADHERRLEVTETRLERLRPVESDDDVQLSRLEVGRR